MNAAQQKNYYDVLGVARDASPEDIRKAYLKLAHKYHPDKTGGDKSAEDQLKEINAAYDTLKNVEKRKKYDLELDGFGGGFGGAGFGGGPRGGGAYQGGFAGNAAGAGFDFSGFTGAGGGFEDIFGSFFSGGMGGQHRRQRRQAVQGADIEAPLSITLEEAYSGVKRQLQLRLQDVCSDCKGSGAAPGTQPQPCAQCGGSGEMQQVQGAFAIRSACPACGGAGEVITQSCPACGGKGRRLVNRKINVTIPAGIADGARLRVASQGEAGTHGGPRGDLYVVVSVAKHAFFERKGDDIICEVPVSITQAALGDKVRVPTLSGIAELSIPEGAQNGQQFRMRGQGMPRLRGGGRGDELVRIYVETPVKLTKRQRELLTELGEINGEEHHPRRWRFLDWLKGLGG